MGRLDINYICDVLTIHVGKYIAKQKIKKLDSLTTISFKNQNIIKGVIVSLTTIPYRLDGAYYSIASIMLQTVRPEKILLVLDQERKDEYIFSEKFQKLFDAGLEIIYREDIRCHTKYYYSISENQDSIVITVDDDCIYSENLIKKLYHSYLKNPNAVSCMRGRRVRYTKEGNYEEYRLWDKSGYFSEDNTKHEIIATGVGGVLYPPHTFDEETFNKEKIKELCLSADDIWLFFMEKRNHVRICKVRGNSQMYVDIPNTQDIALQKSNVTDGRNDMYIENMHKYYQI